MFLYGFAPHWVAGALLDGTLRALLLLVGLFLLLRHEPAGETLRWDAPTLSQSGAEGGSRLRWLLAVLLTVVIFDGPALMTGFFQADDFGVLVRAHHYGPWEILFSHNAGRTLALYHLQAWLEYRVFGLATWPRNLMTAALLCGIHYTAIRILHGWGWRRTVGCVYLILAGSWSLWGEFSSGYYILQIYLWIGFLLLCGCRAIQCACREGAERRGRWMSAAILCGGLAPLVTLAGFIVPIALLWFFWVECRRGRIPLLRMWMEHRHAFCGALVAAVPAVALHLWMYRGGFMGAGGGVAGDRGMVERIVYLSYLLVGGIGIGSFVPSSQPGLHFHGLLALACGVVLLGWGIWFYVSLRRGGRNVRWNAVAGSGIMILLLAMVAYGREMQSYFRPLFGKYTAMPMVWFMIVLAVSVGGWLAASPSDKVGKRKVAIFVGLFLYVLIQMGIDHASGRMGQETFMGRAHHMDDARMRAHRYLGEDDFFHTLDETHPLDGW